jgi:hypothetical protein
MSQLLMLQVRRKQHANNTVRILVILTAVAGLCTFCLCQNRESSLQDILTRHVSSYRQNSTELSRELQDVSSKYNVPIGMEINQEQTPREISIDVVKSTVSEILSLIVAQAPAYKWIEQDGVVNVLPQDNSDSLLDVTIVVNEIVTAWLISHNPFCYNVVGHNLACRIGDKRTSQKSKSRSDGKS